MRTIVVLHTHLLNTTDRWVGWFGLVLAGICLSSSLVVSWFMVWKVSISTLHHLVDFYEH